MEKEKELDVMHQYKNITNKLKKKFLKKPNLAEGSEQFESLARQQKADDNGHYAGICYLAQARCEQALGNWTTEVWALTEAARSFIKEEDFFHHTRCVSFNEDLHSAINCYAHAIRVSSENGQLMQSSQLSIEIGNHLQRFGKTIESMQHFTRAINLLQKNPIQCMDAMELLANASIDANELHQALDTYTSLYNLAKQTATFIEPHKLIATSKERLCQYEGYILLLLLHLQPTSEVTCEQHRRLLRKYSRSVLSDDYMLSFCQWVVTEDGIAMLPRQDGEDLRQDDDNLDQNGKDLGQDDDNLDQNGKDLGQDDDNLGRDGKDLGQDEYLSRPSSKSRSESRSKVDGVKGGLKELKDYMSLEFYFALQSFAMACEDEADEEVLLSCESDLCVFLSPRQQHLCHLVLNKHLHKQQQLISLLHS